jgi:hypothetical protein
MGVVKLKAVDSLSMPLSKPTSLRMKLTSNVKNAFKVLLQSSCLIGTAYGLFCI